VKDRFSAIVEKITEKPQGFCTDKVRKTVIRGLLPEDDLKHIADVLLYRQDSMSKDEMIEDIGKIKMISPEAASVLISAWFDAGKNKQKWDKKELYKWIETKLITKMGSEYRVKKLASVVSGKKVASEYGLFDRKVELKGVDEIGVCVLVTYPIVEDTSVENCKYDIDMLAHLWKESLPIEGSYRIWENMVNPFLEFTVSMSWNREMLGNTLAFEDVQNVVEV
jgi:hypothetical protein